MPLIPLNPAVNVLLPPLEFIATEAGRSSDGLVASIQVLNGSVLAARLLKLLDPTDRHACAEEVAAAMPEVTVIAVEKLLLQLLRGVEGSLRQKNQRGRSRGAEAGSEGESNARAANDAQEHCSTIGTAHSSEGKQPNPTSLPWIDASTKDPLVIPLEAWEALLAANEPPRLFVQGRQPVRLQRGKKDRELRAVDLSPGRLHYELGRAARWYTPIECDGALVRREITLPPMWVVENLLAHPEIPLPALMRITEIPTFLPDGSLHMTPGYHPASGTVYDPPPGVTIPEVPACPSLDDVTLANALLDELLHDFPFVQPADKAHAKALFLLPFVRDLIPEATPNHLIEAPTPGSGKGLLVDVILRPTTGHHPGIVTEARDEDEWRKRLTSHLKEARAVLLLDNIHRPLDSAQLAAALTALYWEDRLSGTNELLKVPVRCVWVTTGNNVVLSSEMARRSIRIRLDPKIDRPWLREGFRHPGLRAWVDQHRGHLIWAALVLGQHWLAQGRPRPTLEPLGSYETWSVVLGGMLQTAGIKGLLANLDEFYEIADQEGAVWRSFVAVWWERFASEEVGAGDLLPLAQQIEGFDLTGRDDAGQRKSLGRKLGQHRDRVVGAHRIVLAGTFQRAKRWRLLATQALKPPRASRESEFCECQ
jgi:putative DNA primase/helicase